MFNKIHPFIIITITTHFDEKMGGEAGGNEEMSWRVPNLSQLLSTTAPSQCRNWINQTLLLSSIRLLAAKCGVIEFAPNESPTIPIYAPPAIFSRTEQDSRSGML